MSRHEVYGYEKLVCYGLNCISYHIFKGPSTEQDDENSRNCHLGTVYTDAVSFVTASVSMRLRLSFTRRRSSSLSEPGRFEYAFKSGAFSKRYGFNGRVNGETASI